MPSFEETLKRMKGLYTYGQEITENVNKHNHTLEYYKQAGDGNFYGIVKECNKYYIKSAPSGKETIAEAYDYLGGFCNKGNYEYTSYANALKNFKLKMASINEACDANVQTEKVDDFGMNAIMTESTKSMSREIARQRQIMYNTAMIMNESTGISRKGDTVKYDGTQPEAENGKCGDEEVCDKEATANPEYTGTKTHGLTKKAEPFTGEPKTCSDQLKEGCSCEGGSHNCDWENWNCEKVDGNPGVGDADTKHNNEPFTNTVNEDEENFDGEDVEDEDLTGDEIDGEGEDMPVDNDIDGEITDDEPIGDEDMSGEDNVDDFDFGQDDDLEPQDGDLEGDEFDDTENAEQEDSDVELELGDEDFDNELPQDTEDEDMFGSDEDTFGDEVPEEDGEGNIEDDDLTNNEDMFGDEDFDGELPQDTEGEDMFGDEDFDDEVPEEDGEGDIEECGDAPDINPMYENKRAKMNQIVENVVNKILNETELNVFGKHPGYRKEPMTLPKTGEDKNQWGEDWNDDSVYSEEPFGSKIGDSMPFDELVNAITNDVLYQLKTGSAFTGKKKMN